MYSKEAANNIAKRDVKYISAGIQENVTIKDIRVDVSPTGKQFLEITFEKDSARMIHTEYEPRFNEYTKTEEELQTKQTNQYSRMLQLLTCFYKNEEIDFNGSSFKEFAEYIKDMLDKADKSKKLRVKIVYNKDGFTTLPNYAKYTFIEPMELPEGQTTAIVQLSIDCFVKPVIADKEEKNTNPFSSNTSTTAAATATDDLPF